MANLHEKKHLNRFSDQDKEAVYSLYLFYVNDLYAYGMKIFPDETLVKDAIQDIFVLLFEKQNKINSGENIKAYIFKSLRNKILEELRSRYRKKEIEKSIFSQREQLQPDYDLLLISEEESLRQKILENAIDKLSKRQKEALYLRFTEDFSYIQISDILGISTDSCRTLIYRTLKQIRSIIFQVSS